MTVPHIERAVVLEEKITLYLLNLDHDKGRSKAIFFLGVGFTIPAWRDFAHALCLHLCSNPVIKVESNRYGTKYIVEGRMISPVGVTSIVRSVWIVRPSSPYPHLITAYPF